MRMTLPKLSAVLLGLLVPATLPAGPLAARDVKLPDPMPQVSIQFPDDWALAATPLGSEAVAPDKKAFVIMKILTRPTDDPNKWVKQALARLEALGVHFETKQTSTLIGPAPAQTAAQDPKKTDPKKTDLKKTETKPTAKVVDPSTTAQAPKTAEPKTADLKTADPKTAAKPADPATPVSQSMPTFAMNANSVTALPPAELVLHAVTYRGSSLDGVPVDVELVTFALSNTQSLFMLQESGSTDSRAIAIIKSVKRAS